MEILRRKCRSASSAVMFASGRKTAPALWPRGPPWPRCASDAENSCFSCRGGVVVVIIVFDGPHKMLGFTFFDVSMPGMDALRPMGVAPKDAPEMDSRSSPGARAAGMVPVLLAGVASSPAARCISGHGRGGLAAAADDA